MGSCSFDGCVRPAQCKGLCSGHYNQQQKGKPLKPLQVQYHGFSEERRFFFRVEKGDASSCWRWTGSTIKAGWHGQWRNTKGQVELAHRAAYRMLVGEIPKGMCILHKCDNPVCVNPKHLFLGTQSDNAKDMWRKRRAKPGKSLGEAHGLAILTEDIVREIRSSSESGVQLARRFGISPTTVCDVRKRRTWQHI